MARQMDPAGRAEVRGLARRILGIENAIKGLSKPRLVSASIEDTALEEYDENGQLVSVIGKQFDGTHGAVTVGGPTPPKPGLAIGTPVPTGIMAEFDGTWADGPTVVAPATFAHFEIHASLDPGFSGLFFDTLRGQIGSARGGRVLIPATPDQQWYLRVVARDQSGKFMPGDVSGPFSGGHVTQEAIDIDWDALGGSQIFYGPDRPTTDKIGDLWYKAISLPSGRQTYETRRWDGTDWTLVADQGVGDAILMAEAADAAAKLRAQYFVQAEPPTGLNSTDVAVWVDTDDGNRSYTWSGSGWVSRRLGSGAIQPNSLIARDVIATGTISAALFEAVMVLATTIVVGPVDGAHVEQSPTGFRFFDVNRDGAVAESGAWGTGTDGFTLTDPDTKQTTTSVTRAGAAFPAVDVAGTDEDGDGQADTGFRVYGREFADWMAPLPQGLQAQGRYFTSTGIIADGIVGPYGIGEIAFDAKARRAYLIVIEGLHYYSSAGQMRALLTLRYTNTGVAPTVSTGSILASKFVDIPVAGDGYSPPPFIVPASFSNVADQEIRLLLVARRFSGATSGSTLGVRSYTSADDYWAPLRWAVYEMGDQVEDSFQVSDGDGTRPTPPAGTTTTPPAPKPVAQKKSYRTTWLSSWETSFLGDGTKRTSSDTTDVMQGFTPYYSAGGNQRGFVGFGGGADYSTAGSEIGKSITSALSGATVSKVEVKLRCIHTHSNAGGTARIGYHGIASEPASMPGAAAYDAVRKFFKPGDEIWVTLPSSTWNDWKSGNYRGVTTGPLGDYMRFDGSGTDRPALRITYTR